MHAIQASIFAGLMLILTTKGVHSLPNYLFGIEKAVQVVRLKDPLSPSETGLLVHLKFDGNTRDASGHGRHAKAFGGTYVSDRNGKSQSAIRLDGINDKVSFGSVPEFQIVGGMTVMAWIRLDSAAFAPTLFQNSYVENVNLGLIFFINPYGGASITMGDGKSVGTNSRRTFHPELKIETEKWLHLTFVAIAENNMKIYLNGEYLPGTYSGNGDGLRYNPLGESVIGMHDGSYQTNQGFHFFKGAIDDFKIFGTALSESDIQAEFLK